MLGQPLDGIAVVGPGGAVRHTGRMMPGPRWEGAAAEAAGDARRASGGAGSEGEAGQGPASGAAASVPLGPLQAARILIVDDELSNVLLLQAVLRRAGFTNVTGTTDPFQALPLVQEVQPDLILLDLRMPGLDGLAVMAQLGPLTGGPIPVPILVLTADVTREAKERALLAGAKDFMTKPPDPVEAVLRIKKRWKDGKPE
jgi:CheY-like chemotaxis protein